MYLWAYDDYVDNRVTNCILQASTRDDILDGIKNQLNAPQVFDSIKVLETYVDLEKILTQTNQTLVYISRQLQVEAPNGMYVMEKFTCPCGCGLKAIEVRKLRTNYEK